jgi:hypothetical protein
MERYLRRFNVRLHRLILRTGVFRAVFFIGLTSFVAGIGFILMGRSIGGTIIEWGVGCTFPILLLMFILLWGTSALYALVARHYTVSVLMGLVTVVVALFLYVTVSSFIPLLFSR